MDDETILVVVIASFFGLLSIMGIGVIFWAILDNLCH